MEAVILAFYEVVPPVSGAATVAFNVVKYMGGKKCLFQISNHRKAYTINKNVTIINVKSVLNNRGIKAGSLLLQLLFITKKIKRLAPRYIIFEGASWTLYYYLLFYLIKLVKMDNMIIYHAHNVEYLLRRQKNGRLIAFITKWAEGRLVRGCDLSFAVSEIDAAYFQKIYGVRPSVLSNGVDVERFAVVTPEEVREIRNKYNLSMKSVLFMGMPAYRPNSEAIDFLIDKVFPLVVDKSDDARLVIIGGQVKQKRDWLKNPGAIPFDEIPAFIKACNVCVAPIFSGSGTRLKILEYMAAGKPVISTSKGAEGIFVSDRENIVISESPDDFASKVTYLLENQEVAETIGNEGRKLVTSSYSWAKIMENFNREIVELFQSKEVKGK